MSKFYEQRKTWVNIYSIEDFYWLNKIVSVGNYPKTPTHVKKNIYIGKN